MTTINRKAPFQKQLLDMSNAIDELQQGIVVDAYTKEEADAKFQTIEGMSDYYTDDYIDENLYTKTQADNKFLAQTALTDYSIDNIIMGNSEIDNDNVDLRAVYSQDVKSEISADPNSIIIRTMSGTDVSTLGISATEIDVITPMLKYGTYEVATKNDLTSKQDTLISSGTGQNIKTINNESILGTGNISLPGYSGNHLYMVSGTFSDGLPTSTTEYLGSYNGILSSPNDYADGLKNITEWCTAYGNIWLSKMNVSYIRKDGIVTLCHNWVSISNNQLSISYDYFNNQTYSHDVGLTSTSGSIQITKIY